ncbi:MAG: tetratricopeptide repeat protein [Candidatus Omnitrophica bacterium]|nr:tetratricopeptide repeat protein [Candidatus Omnitrophota bacterium]
MRRVTKRIGWGLLLCLPLLVFLSFRCCALDSDKKTSDALSHYIMAVLYDRQDKLDQAITEYKLALKQDYNNSVIHLNLAAAYIRDNQFEEAIAELNIASELAPDAVEPHAILALIYSLQDQPEAAGAAYESALKKASKLQPENIDIYKSLGQFYFQQGNFAAAAGIFRTVLELSVDDAEAHFYLGNIYYELDDKFGIETELREAVRLDPEYAEALNFLGYFLVEEGRNFKEASRLIQKALKISPDNGAYIDSLGWLYFKQGKFKEALSQLRRSAELMEDPIIYDHLGDAYFAVGDQQKAIENWQRSLDLDPQQEAVKNKIDGHNLEE